MKWYYLRGQQRQGPVASAELKRLARNGELRPEDRVMREGASQWGAAGSIRGLFSELPVAQEVPPARSRSPWGGLPKWAWALLVFAAIAVPIVAIASYRGHEPAPPQVVAPSSEPIRILPASPPAKVSKSPTEVKTPVRLGPELLVWPRLVPRYRTELPAYPHTLEEIKKTLAKLAPPANRERKVDEDRQTALRRLMAYRFLAGVSYENLELDAEMTRTSQAGAELCQKAQELSHYPKNPGLLEEEYEFGIRGTSNSNLAVGYRDLVQAMDAWMDDSDPSNIDQIGHRRWCLNPPLLKTGFGRTKDFTAMWANDSSQPHVPDYDIVPFPAAGYMPFHLFPARAAWSVSINPHKYRADSILQVFLYSVDAKGQKSAEPLKLDYQRVDVSEFGLPCCVIFRPAGFAVAPGKRFLVILEGLRKHSGEPIDPIEYPVEFVSLR